MKPPIVNTIVCLRSVLLEKILGGLIQLFKTQTEQPFWNHLFSGNPYGIFPYSWRLITDPLGNLALGIESQNVTDGRDLEILGRLLMLEKRNGS